MVILVSAEQLLKQYVAIVVNELGKVISVKEEQYENAYEPIEETLLGMVIFLSEVL